jgi:hypothetical protein
MESETRQLALEPEVRADPLLSSLLIARADKIRALHRAGELRDLLQRRDLVDLAIQFVRHADARAFVSRAIRKKLARRASSGEVRP